MNLKELLPYDITPFLEKGELNNELEFHRAKIANYRLRILSKENPELKNIRKSLKTLLLNYEQKHWSNYNLVTDKQIKESEIAEQIAEEERINFKTT